MKDEKTKKLPSRYKDVDTKYVLDRGKHHAFIVTNSSYVRLGLGNNENIRQQSASFIDFEGGPMLNIGDNFEGKRIKSIEGGYIITLE